MNKLCYLFLAIALSTIAGTAIGQDTPSATTPRFLKRITVDTRRQDKIAIYDVGNLPFEKITKEDDQIWVLAQITPLPKDYSGFTIINDHTTGRVTGPPPIAFRSTEQGMFDVKSSLTGKSVISEKYDYEVPQVYNGPSRVVDHNLYSPFRVGGFAVCHIDQQGQGKDRYDQIYVVPGEWQSFVVPAFAFYHANAALFSSDEAQMPPGSKAHLKALLISPNPFLATLACRTLAKDGALDSTTAVTALGQPDSFRQAAMTFILLTSVPNAATLAQAAQETAIDGLADSAQSEEDLDGVTLGVALADDIVGSDATRNALRHLAEAQKELAPATVSAPSSSYVSTLLNQSTSLSKQE